MGWTADAIQQIEHHNSSRPTSNIQHATFTITPNALSVQQATKLKDRLERYSASTEIKTLLEFAIKIKEGEREAALYVVSKLNTALAKQLVDAARERIGLQKRLQVLEAEEQYELQREARRLESLSECELRAEMGSPCQAIDYFFNIATNIISLAPQRLLLAALSRAGLAGKATAGVTRAQLQRFPTLANIATRYSWKRATTGTELQRQMQQEEFLIQALLDLKRKFIVQFVKSSLHDLGS